MRRDAAWMAFSSGIHSGRPGIGPAEPVPAFAARSSRWVAAVKRPWPPVEIDAGAVMLRAGLPVHGNRTRSTSRSAGAAQAIVGMVVVSLHVSSTDVEMIANVQRTTQYFKSY